MFHPHSITQLLSRFMMTKNLTNIISNPFIITDSHLKDQEKKEDGKKSHVILIPAFIAQILPILQI